MKTKILDILGASAALLCLIHCIAFPVLMIVPFGISHNAFIDLFFFVIGVFIVFRITKKTKSITLRILFWSSILLIGISVGLDFMFHIHSELILAGAAGLITAHILNFKNHKH
ncbi:MerC domain-containing protein [Chryseobacterium salviniae]|uniref:MerC domain-containing protein n=1 Tax=Chryseobacterium salviniae TaxID=3101750 RepID=A0ABU6HWC9_9FLAO|nr:MerC domain-containing protein [Chryseobacterium sp. T9W2-O]MEC3877381.1 MerC domain-containing protein [Chryseobacterium sp. T9W2-O]